MAPAAAGTGWRLLALVALQCLFISSIHAQQWFMIRPPARYYTPDVDTTSATPLPRVPPSPYGDPARICAPADGTPFSVDGYPGTPYVLTPFTELYRQPPDLAPVAQQCRTGDPAPAHCIKAYQISIDAFQSNSFHNAVQACRTQPGTWTMGYNGMSPGPTMRNSV